MSRAATVLGMVVAAALTGFAGGGAANAQWPTAQVLTPYQSGAMYISSGRGLGTIFNEMSEPNWQVLGPISATL